MISNDNLIEEIIAIRIRYKMDEKQIYT